MDNETIVAEFDNRMRAEIAVNLLESFGVDSHIWADDLGGIGPGQSFVRGVKILVEAGDADKAKEILSREK